MKHPGDCFAPVRFRRKGLAFAVGVIYGKHVQTLTPCRPRNFEHAILVHEKSIGSRGGIGHSQHTGRLQVRPLLSPDQETAALPRIAFRRMSMEATDQGVWNGKDHAKVLQVDRIRSILAPAWAE